MKNNETLQSLEKFSPKENRQECQAQQLDTLSIESLFSLRAEMLLGIEHDIELSLFEELYWKIEYESKFLTDIIASDTRAIKSKKQMNRTLNAKYFIRKHFNANLI